MVCSVIEGSQWFDCSIPQGWVARFLARRWQTQANLTTILTSPSASFLRACNGTRFIARSRRQSAHAESYQSTCQRIVYHHHNVFFTLTGGLGIYFMIFPAEWMDQGLTILLGFGALLIGLFPVYHTTKDFLRQNRLAAPHIVVSQLPFTAGSTINGLLNQRVKPGAKVLSLIITLRCVKEIRDCESSAVKCLYEDPHELLPDQLVTTRNGINEYFSFDIPNRKHFPNSKRRSIHWSLTVTTSVAGWPDYKHEYTVKVFDVG